MSSAATTSFFFNSTSAVHTLAVEHPRTNNNQPYSYGTSGFRGLAATLPAITLRMGFLAALRSLSLHTGSSTHAPVVGVMVTASHNDAPDNGVKLCDPDGSMMASHWEDIATQLANTTEAAVASFLKQQTQQLKLNLESVKPRVYVGRDTRASSPSLCALVVEGVQAMGGEVVDYGVVTTPQLHWVVRRANEGKDASVDAYYKTLSTAFATALRCKPGHSGAGVRLPPLVVDCANGVGAISLQHLAPLLPQLPLQLVNTSTAEGLNDECGAEHVQKTRQLPKLSTATSSAAVAASTAVTHPIPAPTTSEAATAPQHTMDLVDTTIPTATSSTPTFTAAPPSSSSPSPFAPHARLASVDGDADRLVYYYVDEQRRLHLMDGDKIISLYTALLTSLLARSPALSAASHKPSMGIVQTAYANGASTTYMRRQLQIEPQFTPTGVKHLHHVAAEYDVGIYFEANGHGTVLFKPEWVSKVRGVGASGGEDGAVVECVLALVELVNQCVGDAVSDLLLVEVALHALGWSLAQWDAIYADLPSSMLKVRVKDRSVITTTNAERTCVTPQGLQAEIDRLVGGGEGRRAFVRPSGTEDIVRVYAEAATREEVDVLAKQVCDAVFRLAGGIQ